MCFMYRDLDIDDRVKVGRFGEDIAKKYLENLGWRIICRNWRCSRGEIDIIAQNKREFVCVEVRTKRSLFSGDAAESLNGKKLRRMTKLAHLWWYQYKSGQEDGGQEERGLNEGKPKESKLAGYTLRIDAIAILLKDSALLDLVHYRSIGGDIW